MARSKKWDCILLPGGGLNPDGSLPGWVVPRMERALELEGQAQWLITLSGGTVHKAPPRDGEGFPLFESRQAAAWLVEKGIEPKRVLSETSSYDTIGNAYFARAQLCEPLGLERCLVITSRFHLSRVKRIFQWVFGLPPSEVDFQLDFQGTPDQGLAPAALAARYEKEAQSLAALERTIPNLESWPALAKWLFTEHQAYAAQAAGFSQGGLRDEALNEDQLSSY